MHVMLILVIRSMSSVNFSKNFRYQFMKVKAVVPMLTDEYAL